MTSDHGKRIPARFGKLLIKVLQPFGFKPGGGCLRIRLSRVKQNAARAEGWENGVEILRDHDETEIRRRLLHHLEKN